MFRIRFHGRGGQGMKTASRILGTAFFCEGFQVQDAPRYGAERRGAPIFAYVRAAREPIDERGIIDRPDLAVVADDTLIGIPAAGVLAGLQGGTVLLIHSSDDAASWRHRLNVDNEIRVLPIRASPPDQSDRAHIGAGCAGAAARLVGVIGKDSLARAVRRELEGLGTGVVAANLEQALAAFELMSDAAGTVAPAADPRADHYDPPDWVDLPLDEARVSAPVIHAAATSVEVRTGLWRTLRPVIDYERCHRCWWVCSTYCPDSAIPVVDGKPAIDYEHCKGCMICVAQCPSHAIEAVPEREAQLEEASS